MTAYVESPEGFHPRDGAGKPYIKVSQELHDAIIKLGEENITSVLKREYPELFI